MYSYSYSIVFLSIHALYFVSLIFPTHYVYTTHTSYRHMLADSTELLHRYPEFIGIDDEELKVGYILAYVIHLWCILLQPYCMPHLQCEYRQPYYIIHIRIISSI